MDRKLRQLITSGLQKHATLEIAIRNDDSSSDSTDSDDDRFVGNPMHTTMYDLETNLPHHNNDQTSSDQCGQNYAQLNRIYQTRNNNQAIVAPPVEDNTDENAMDVSSPQVVGSHDAVSHNVKITDECVDQEMSSVKSDKESLPSMIRNPMLRCEICGVDVQNQSTFNKHIKSHGEFRYQCSVCSRWFEKRHQLNIHQKTHSGTKSFTCSLCEKRFTSQTNLGRHIRVIHKPQNHHTCSTCQKTFDQLASLRLHQSVHEAERKFGCDICNQKFKSEINLKLHKKRHLPTEIRLKRKYSPPKKTYKSPLKLCVCTECGKRFTSIAMLRSHMQ